MTTQELIQKYVGTKNNPLNGKTFKEISELAKEETKKEQKK